MDMLQEEQSWSPLSGGTTIAYTRPLLGSELFADQASVLFDGLADCCMGFTFATLLRPPEIESLLREAMMRLRFVCPIVASSLERGIHDLQLRSWVYSPAQNVEQVRQWAQQTVVRSEPMHIEEFIGMTTQRRLPYILADGSKQILRCFLLQIPEKKDTFAIFFHGTHALMDAWPTINVLSLLFGYMSMTATESVDELPWGTEWTRLPVGPISATGGPREGWDVHGIPLLDKIAQIYANPIPSHGLICQRREARVVGRTNRIMTSLDSTTSTQVLQRLKGIGFSATQLFEAAQILAIFALNPVSDAEAGTAHITFPRSIISLARFLTPPHNMKSNFISLMCLVPIGLRYEDLLVSDQPKDRLVSLLQKLKAQYDIYLNNQHLPHITAVQMKLRPPREPQIDPNPYSTSVTNLGVVERNIQLTYPADQEPLFAIGELCFGHRKTTASPLTHVWTMHSRITVQIQASDIWDTQYLRAYLDEIIRQALVILD